MYFTPISDITIGFVTKPNSLATFLGKNIQKKVKKGVRSCSSCATFPRGEYGKTAGFRGDKKPWAHKKKKKRGLREMGSTGWFGGIN